MQWYSRVQVTSLAPRLIQRFQYLRLTHIDLRMAAFKDEHTNLHTLLDARKSKHFAL